VHYSSGEDNDNEGSQIASNTQYRLIHLNPSTSYKISVSAVTSNPNGEDLEGPRSNTVDTKTSFSGKQ